MTVNTANIDKGMEVFGSDDEKIGKIESIIRDPSAETGMEQYRDAVNANVGTSAGIDDADAESGMTASGRTVEAGTGSSGLPFGSSGEQGDATAAGLGSGTGTAGFGALGGFQGVEQSEATTASSTQSESSSGGYLHVKESGLLGLGGKDLYVPTSAVEDMTPGDCVTLNVTKAQAEERYAHQPD